LVRLPFVWINSPAKVNLRLEVLSRRPDGYHDIRTVMVPISLSDTLRISPKRDKGIDLTCSRKELPVDDRNLAYKACLLIIDATGTPWGFRIQIEKKIPVAAGLGGGSSNAASTLIGVNKLLGAPLTRPTLMKLAEKLGADVPFFVFGRPALATGIGERLEILPGLPSLWFLLVHPGIPISTRWAYDRINLWLTNSRDHISIPAFPGDTRQLAPYMLNDLEKPVFEEYPLLRKIKDRISGVGALASLMSGSGSTVFGVFPREQEARQAYEKLKREFADRDWEVFLARNSG
jgi:4-diphosphocytidyl-2-C-methyl-D-erythritol kinase